jgi:tetratricopeptide (TPR) repeat protein
VTADKPFDIELRFLAGPNAADLNGINEATRDLARAYLASGLRLMYSAKIELAIEHIQEGIRLARLNTDRLAESAGLASLGNVHYYWEDAEQALCCYRRALDIARQLGAQQGQAYLLFNISLTLDALAERKQAVRSATNSLAILNEIEDPAADRVSLVLALWQGDAAHAS